METTKPTLTSKTILTNLALAIYAALAFFGVLPAGLDSPEMIAGLTVLGNLLAAYFRKSATAKLA